MSEGPGRLDADKGDMADDFRDEAVIEVMETDDPGFVELVRRTIHGVIAIAAYSEIEVFRIDNWFDHKWLEFAGRIDGSVTMPPFSANRVISLRAFGVSPGSSRLQERDPERVSKEWLNSSDNRQRRTSLGRCARALLWFTGKSRLNGKGAIMAYVPIGQDAYHTWYVSFNGSASWSVEKTKGTSRAEFLQLLESTKPDDQGRHR